MEGVGPIAFPLLQAQAEQLVAVAERAPYGRGEDTLVDTEVRRTWQIDAARVRIQGKHWEKTLQSIVARATAGLGVSGSVAADLYKLLVYDAGSFFVSHRDTEKVAGMFATLVIVLPSIYTGGELIVRHQGREVRLELSRPEPSEVAFAAFYADCMHEVLSVASGCRLALIYNLRRSRGELPKPPDYADEQAYVAGLLRDWCDGKAFPDEDMDAEASTVAPLADATPVKLIYPLEHAYTPAKLSFDALKGADAAVAGVLVGAAEQAGCDLHLALVSIWESGDAEYLGYYGRRRYRSVDDEEEEDPADFSVGDVYDRKLTLSDWRRPDAKPANLGDFPFVEEELCPPDAFEGLKPDEQHFSEATGNEGASFERTYRRAGLVLWPKARKLAVLNQVGLGSTLPFLGGLARDWAASGMGAEAPLWREAHELSGYMLQTWPREYNIYRSQEHAGQAAAMLAALSRLQDRERIEAFLRTGLTAAGAYDRAVNEALLQALDLLPPSRANAMIEAIVAGHAPARLSACGDLLARAALARDADGAKALLPAAVKLFEALPGEPPRASLYPGWQRPLAAEPGFVVDLLSALNRIDPALAGQAVGHMLAWPATYTPDEVLVPAALQLRETASGDDPTAARRLLVACLDHLRARIAEPLEPPRDWARASDVGCTCAHCRELSQFLADPVRKEWIFKAAEGSRKHMTSSVRNSGADLDLRTDKRGRPYGLVCTKNQASYERRVLQRTKDQLDLARLESGAGG